MSTLSPLSPLSFLSGLPEQPITHDVLAEKYLKPGEHTANDVFRRVAQALASVEAPASAQDWASRYLAHLQGGAIGAGRIMSAAGTGIQATLINCFVQPVGDCIQGVDEGGFPGIYEALREAAETMRRGGGVGYDFSRIRPKGAHVAGTASVASGPCSYINVFDQSCATVESAGARRGAQMGVLRIDHPDVLEFIQAKRTPGRWSNFNVSVGVTDAFMQALADDRPWPLVHTAAPGAALLGAAQGMTQRDDGVWVYRCLPARELWETLMASAYAHAEPGVLFLDTIARDNNLRYCEHITATNPCGEQPLPPYGCCDLGPLVLPRFVRHPFGCGGEPSFDFERFEHAVALQVRVLDNVLELTHWPLPQQAAQAQAKRRIGVGFTGLGNALTLLGLRYDRPEGRAMAVDIARCMRDAAYTASVALAQERGAFPCFDADRYLEAGTFASRLPPALQQAIATHGIRNSHLLSIAPTGTVSLAFADNTSNGIEPPFAWVYRRKKRQADGSIAEYDVEDHAWRLFRHVGGDTSALPPAFVSALEMGADDHIAMVAAVQGFIDTSISKTVNVPEHHPYSDFKGLYTQAWRAGLKGLTTYRPNATVGAVLETLTTAARPTPLAPDASTLATNVVEKRPKGALPAVVEKIEYWTHEGRKTLYLVVSFLTLEAGAQRVERAIEFFMPVGQSGESQQWITASMRLLSLAARGGFLARALEDMRKVAWDRGPVRLGTHTRADGTEVPLWHDSEVAAVAHAIQHILMRRSTPTADTAGCAVPSAAPAVGRQEAARTVDGWRGRKCPECGAHALMRKDGCDGCSACGYVGACG